MIFSKPDKRQINLYHFQKVIPNWKLWKFGIKAQYSLPSESLFSLKNLNCSAVVQKKLNRQGDLLSLRIQSDGSSAFAVHCKSIKSCVISFAVFPNFVKNIFSFGFSVKHSC